MRRKISFVAEDILIVVANCFLHCLLLVVVIVIFVVTVDKITVVS